LTWATAALIRVVQTVEPLPAFRTNAGVVVILVVAFALARVLARQRGTLVNVLVTVEAAEPPDTGAAVLVLFDRREARLSTRRTVLARGAQTLIGVNSTVPAFVAAVTSTLIVVHFFETGPLFLCTASTLVLTWMRPAFVDVNLALAAFKAISTAALVLIDTATRRARGVVLAWPGSAFVNILAAVFEI